MRSHRVVFVGAFRGRGSCGSFQIGPKGLPVLTSGYMISLVLALLSPYSNASFWHLGHLVTV